LVEDVPVGRPIEAWPVAVVQPSPSFVSVDRSTHFDNLPEERDFSVWEDRREGRILRMEFDLAVAKTQALDRGLVVDQRHDDGTRISGRLATHDDHIVR
tara:strand:+ start:521 stop:817 length:297 start_codon:yes stop_codon:yes gene_type:complete